MVTYKKNDFLGYMSEVQKCKNSISMLNDQWENIKLQCEINCPNQSKSLLPMMTNIQNNFIDLQQKLIDTLVTEALNKMSQKIISKAQVAIDILIRNLYERTADVGFLATDDDIRSFVSFKERSKSDEEYIIKRLQEYVAKYSVYEEIVILDKSYKVIANLDQSNEIKGKILYNETLEKTLYSNESFIETFDESPLQPDKKKSHIFSRKIFAENSEEVVGILCLCFRFENEMKQIFKNLSTDYDGSVIMIVDNDNIVIASNDENQVPVGIKVELVENSNSGIVYYRGLAYIAKTVKTQGYQDYYGLGWRGHIMIPIHLAFRDKSDLSEIDSEITAGLMNEADSFSGALNEIIDKTQEINNTLKRIVYNGQILSKDDNGNDEYSKLKCILDKIGKIGISTSHLFRKSVQNLFATVVSTSLVDAGFTASLCINIMDRNLYERADDCRWWALNSTFRTILAKNNITEEDLGKLTKILSYINSLYTIYSNLFLFDKNGEIIAISNSEYSDIIGTSLNNAYIHNILYNTLAEKYFVSPFEATTLYKNRYTYIYGASITDINNEKHTVGGIGIVFDSEYQFKTMLKDALNSNANSFAVFTDRKGSVISSTVNELSPGKKLDLSNSKLFQVGNGKTKSEILVYNECYYAVGCACSSSYREYKKSDGYQNDVLAFVFQKLADCGSSSIYTADNQSVEQSDIMLKEGETQKLVVFEINHQPFALDQSLVLEAIDTSGIIALPGVGEIIKGAVQFNDKYIAVVDMHATFHYNEEGSPGSHLLIIELSDSVHIALEVDNLSSVIEINKSDIRPVPEICCSSSFISGIICIPGKDNSTMLLLDAKALLSKLEENQNGYEWNDILQIIGDLSAEKDEN